MRFRFCFKNSQVYFPLKVLGRFQHIMGLRPFYVMIRMILSLAISLLDGVSLVLLIPIAQGIAGNDFGFISNLPVFRQIAAAFPQMLIGASDDKNKALFILIVAMIVAAVVIRNILKYAGSVLSSYWNGKFSRNIKVHIFKRYLSFGKLFFDRTNQGYLNVLFTYANNVPWTLELLQHAVLTAFTVGVYIIVMVAISPKLTLIALIVLPVLHYSLQWLAKKVSQMAEESTRATIELSEKVFNILSCIPLIKAYTGEAQAKKTYGNMAEQLRKISFKEHKIGGLSGPIQEIIILITLLLMISFVTFGLIKDHVAEISTYIVFLYVAQRVLPMFRVFNDVKLSLLQIGPSLKEVSAVLDDKNKFFVREGKREFSGLNSGIVFSRLNFSYLKTVPVLKDISFSIEKGKISAIVGPTGAGKTTLINLILRFYDCPQQAIKIDGTDIREFTLKSLRSRMALVSQDIWLFNDSLRNNIIFGMDKQVSDEALIDVAQKTQLYDFIAGLPDGFDTLIGDRGIKLSGGEKQRVAIARAFLRNAEILVLDEATSSLDSRTENLIQQAINQAAKDRTAIIIAHRLSTIKRADKIIVIENGRVVEQGALRELLDNKGKFYQYWQEQKFF